MIFLSQEFTDCEGNRIGELLDFESLLFAVSESLVNKNEFGFF
jgi:hypothetical protein